AGERVGQGIWLLQAVVLPSPSRVRAERIGRPDAPEAGTPQRPQTDPDGHGILDPGTRGRALPATRTISNLGQEKFRSPGSPTQYRTPVSAPKKTAVTPSPPLLCRAPRDDALIARYEELRQQALGQRCEIPRGQGL